MSTKSNPTTINTGAGLTGGPFTDIGTITQTVLINAQTGTSYAIQTTDNCKLITFNNASAVAVTLSHATVAGFGVGFNFSVWNYGAGTVTITPSTSTINNGASTLVIKQNTGGEIVSDGANYQVSGCTALTPTSTNPAFVYRNYIGGLTISQSGNTAVAVSIGMCTDSTNAFLLSIASFTKSISATFVAGTGNGGLDTGAVAASKAYHIFVIANSTGTTTDILISLSATAPTMPSGYTLFRRIGAICSNSSSKLLTITQLGDVFYLSGLGLAISSVTPTTSSRTLYALPVPLGVKVRPFATFATNASSLQAFIITSPDEPDVLPVTSGTALPLSDLNQTATTDQVNYTLQGTHYTNTSGQLGIRSSAASNAMSMFVYGWIDDRGKNN